MRKQLTSLIVDDERLARQELRSMLSEHPGIQVIGEADSVQTAIESISDLKPNVVFLDIQMPGESGFDLLDKIDMTFEVIFVTAFDHYAIRAFEVNAMDYLLKPIHPDRLNHAIERLSKNSDNRTKKVSIKKLEYDDRLFISVDDHSKFLKVSSIQCICAAGDYSEIYTLNGKKILILKSLKEWEERLPAKYFARIHRSTIVNFEYVDSIEKWFNYSYRIYLQNIEEPYTISRRYAAKLKEKFR